MPINDLIRDRKVAPDQLAFETGGRIRGVGGARVTYQSQVIQQTLNVINVTVNEATQAIRDAQHMVRDAEMRAKNWASDWHRNFHWDVNTNIGVQNNVWHPIAFSNEHMRGMGCQPVGGFVAPVAWKWVVPYGWEGSWFLFAHLSINVQAAALVQQASLGITVNNVIRIVIDRADIEMAGDNAGYMRDVILRSGTQISVQPHDEVAVAVFLAGAAGTDTYTHPSSVTGYVDGFRTRCGDDYIIDSSGDNSGYVFT